MGRSFCRGPPEGPLAGHIGSFTDWLHEQGFAASSLWQRVHLAGCFSGWLGQRIPLSKISPEHPIQYLRYRARQARPLKADRATLRRLLEFLRGEGVIPPQRAKRVNLSPAERCVKAFEQYLREDRALADATIINYVPIICSFLKDRFGCGAVKLSRLRAGDVVGFVQRQASQLRMKRAKLLTTALRSFLQYVRYRGEVRLDLAAAVPVVANWSMASLPRAIASDQVQQLLASINRRTAMGRRDYAILLLLARLGLASK